MKDLVMDFAGSRPTAYDFEDFLRRADITDAVAYCRESTRHLIDDAFNGPYTTKRLRIESVGFRGGRIEFHSLDLVDPGQIAFVTPAGVEVGRMVNIG